MTLTEVSYGARLTALAADHDAEVDLVFAGRDGSEVGVSWATLETRANQIARSFADRVGPGDVVVLALPNCLDHILVTLATWKLGGTVLPLREDLPAWELDRLIALADPRVIVARAGVVDGAVTPDDLAATAALDGHPPPDAVSEYTQLVASSGSTGSPKLIAVPARGVVGGDAQLIHSSGRGRQTTLVVSPLYHVNGFAFAAPRLLEGNRVVVMEHFDAAHAVELIERHRVNHTVMVPTMLQRIARLPDLPASRLASLETVVYGGATIPEWVVDRWLELIEPEHFLFVYGSSERLAVCTMTGADWAAHRGSTGMVRDADLRIIGPDGDEVAVGEVGDIYFRPFAGRPLFRYIGREMPAPTADGYLTIGDVGCVDADGYLYVKDRRHDMIITGGANVFPAEVEQVLSQHPRVADQVVVGVADVEWGRRVHAILQPADPVDPPDVDDLREWCRARLAAYKVPKTYEILERLPRTAAGKLNRSQLAEARSTVPPP